MVEAARLWWMTLASYMPSYGNKSRVTYEYDSTDGKPCNGVRFHSVVVTLGKGYAHFIIIEPIVPYFGVRVCVLCYALLSARIVSKRHSGRRYTFHWHSMVCALCVYGSHCRRRHTAFSFRVHTFSHHLWAYIQLHAVSLNGFVG